MRSLAVIIPHCRSTAQLEDTLVSVLQNRPPDCQVLVPHASNYDDPYQIADEVTFVVLPPGTGWAECVNAAVDRTQAEIVHLLEPGIEVDEGWTDAARKRLDDPRVAIVWPTVVCRSGDQPIWHTGLRLAASGRCVVDRVFCEEKLLAAARRSPHGPIRAAGFYRRRVWQALGGVDRSLDDRLAILDLALAIRRLGLIGAFEPQAAVRASADVVDDAMGAERRFGLARSESRIWRRHADQLKGISRAFHPLLVAGRCLGHLWPPARWPALVAWSLAPFDMGDRRRFAARLAAAQKSLTDQPDARISPRPSPSSDQQPHPASRRRRAA